VFQKLYFIQKTDFYDDVAANVLHSSCFNTICRIEINLNYEKFLPRLLGVEK